MKITTQLRRGFLKAGARAGLLVAVAYSFTALSPGVASADEAANFSNRPLRLVVPFPPGGPSDLTARAISNGMADALGQPVVVENRPGAGAIVAAQNVLGSPHDGYTLMMASNIISTGKALYPHMPFEPLKDFRAVAGVFRSPHIVVVPPNFPGDNINDLIEYAKQQGDKMNYASSGVGTMPQLGTEYFKQLTGAPMLAIPYKGSGPALTAVMAGEVPVYFDILLSAQEFVRAKRLKPLAVTSRERVPQFPDVPTVIEQGIDNFELYSWFGIVVPSDVPDAIVDKLNEAINTAMQTPQFKRQIESLSALPIGGEPEVFQGMIEADAELWARIIKEAGLTIEQ